MRVSACVVICGLLFVAAERGARADDDPAVASAKAFLELVNSKGTLPAPTKKKPFSYGVFPYAADSCNKLAVGKATKAKQLDKVATCVRDAFAEQGANPTIEWEISDDSFASIAFEKKESAIEKAVKGMTIVAAEVNSDEAPAALHLFFAIDKTGAVRGAYLYVDSAN